MSNAIYDDTSLMYWEKYIPWYFITSLCYLIFMPDGGYTNWYNFEKRVHISFNSIKQIICKFGDSLKNIQIHRKGTMLLDWNNQ